MGRSPFVYNAVGPGIFPAAFLSRKKAWIISGQRTARAFITRNVLAASMVGAASPADRPPINGGMIIAGGKQGERKARPGAGEAGIAPKTSREHWSPRAPDGAGEEHHDAETEFCAHARKPKSFRGKSNARAASAKIIRTGRRVNQ